MPQPLRHPTQQGRDTRAIGSRPPQLQACGGAFRPATTRLGARFCGRGSGGDAHAVGNAAEPAAASATHSSPPPKGSAISPSYPAATRPNTSAANGKSSTRTSARAGSRQPLQGRRVHGADRIDTGDGPGQGERCVGGPAHDAVSDSRVALSPPHHLDGGHAVASATASGMTLATAERARRLQRRGGRTAERSADPSSRGAREYVTGITAEEPRSSGGGWGC